MSGGRPHLGSITAALRAWPGRLCFMSDVAVAVEGFRASEKSELLWVWEEG